jgi:hypothetical protein
MAGYLAYLAVPTKCHCDNNNTFKHYPISPVETTAMKVIPSFLEQRKTISAATRNSGTTPSVTK